MGRTLALLACLIAAAVVAWFAEQPPRPAPVDAPAEAFSAARAFPDIAAVARAPHPTGSAANAEVRAHLLRRMVELGLQPRTQETDIFVSHARAAPFPLLSGGRVVNLIGVLPGRDRTLPAVAIMAHYDSVPASPGAADDATGVAAALEAARALKARGPRLRDVAIVLTEGEEQDLLGARAFFDRDPLARRIGFVVNMEARGGGGRARMFQTGPRNGETIALFQRAVGQPSAASLAVYLYGIMPNDTDFSVSRAKGLPGVNLAFIGRQFDYHAASSTPANLDLGSAQDIGAQALAVADRAAQARTLPRPASDWAFSQLPLGPLVGYPAALGWGVLAAAVGLVWLGVRRATPGAIVRDDVLRGAGASLFLLFGAATVIHAARRATGVGFGFLEQRALLARAEPFEAALLLLSVGVLLYTATELARGRRGIAGFALAAGLIGLVLGGFQPVSLTLAVMSVILALLTFRRPAATPGAWLGIILMTVPAAVALQVAAPPAAPLAAWPLLLAAALAAASGFSTQRSWRMRAGLGVGAAIGLAWLGGVAHGLYVGLDAPELLAGVVWLAAPLIWPLAQPDRDVAGTPFAAAFVLACGIAALAFVRAGEPWSARYPQPSQVVYQQDLSTGEAYRIDATPASSGWSEDVLLADGGDMRAYRLPLVFDRSVNAAPAKPVAAVAPAFALTPGTEGRLTLTVTPPPGAASLQLEIAGAVALAEIGAGGAILPAALRPGRSIRVSWTGSTPFALDFRAETPGAIGLAYAAVTPGWPAGASALPARPREVEPFGVSDSTVVTGVQRLTW